MTSKQIIQCISNPRCMNYMASDEVPIAQYYPSPVSPYAVAALNTRAIARRGWFKLTRVEI